MKLRTVICILTVFVTVGTEAQMYKKTVWEQKNLVSIKVSQLFYEVNIGVNLFPQEHTADFVYMAFGYGNPTKKNAWRKFTPENEIPDGLPKTLKEKLSNSGTKDLYAGKIGIGWNHWFNHTLGGYIQAGWGFIADLSTGDDFTEEEKALLTNTNEKNTFIYNTVPVEIGLTLNMWKHLNFQTGVTYMWKEIPLLTIGVGYVF